jgi:two-component system response regulator HydG
MARKPQVVEESHASTVKDRVLAAAPTSNWAVVVTGGPDQGKSFTLDDAGPPRVLVGQSPACEIRLQDPRVSRRHVALEHAGGRLRLTDLGSTNGTLVNGLSVGEVLLGGGETIRIGATTLSVRASTTDRPGDRPTVDRWGRLVGGSDEMRRLHPLCQRLAASDIPLVIEGETGTGKEVLAESIHEASSRANGSFVIFDCTAVPSSLLESALFGHERGAFTGAVSARKGAFEQAQDGTLLIDEIGELDLALQPKLLRAIQRGEIQRVGADSWTKVNVRVLAATRRDLDREVAAGRFRDDLFYRLAVARIELPPLRRRQGDIALLTRHFWSELGGDESPTPPDLLARLEDHTWPGNVRELRNAVARHLALGDLAKVGTQRPPPLEGDEFVSGSLASVALDTLGGPTLLDLPFTKAKQALLEEFERQYVERAVERHGGNVARAAAAAGIAMRYFQLIRARRRSPT